MREKRVQREHLKCQICGATAQRVCSDYPGYRAGMLFSIYACTNCDTSFADPMAVDASIYEDIYRNAKNIVGYARYAKYAEVLLDSEDPLGQLAASENVYWGIAKAFREHPHWQRVLEVGSGYGYLTYALSQSGLQASGIDVSEEAIRGARAQFGNLFEASDISSFQNHTDPEGFDAVVFTELIEHMPDVQNFIASALRLLKPGGALIFTTPNKSMYPSRVWQTDLPPVHLWWFSERSLLEIARNHGCDISFTDFTRFNQRHLCFIGRGAATVPQSCIDAAGNSLVPHKEHSAIWHMLRSTLRLPIVSHIVCFLTGRKKLVGPKSSTICAILMPS